MIAKSKYFSLKEKYVYNRLNIQETTKNIHNIGHRMHMTIIKIICVSIVFQFQLEYFVFQLLYITIRVL